MKKKRHSHSCNMPGPNSGKNVSPMHRGVTSKAITQMYNKYYRDQVAALYRALHTDG